MCANHGIDPRRPLFPMPLRSRLEATQAFLASTSFGVAAPRRARQLRKQARRTVDGEGWRPVETATVALVVDVRVLVVAMPPRGGGGPE